MLDSLDNVNFPTKGFLINVEAERLFDVSGRNGSNNIYLAQALVPLSSGRWTVLLGGKLGKAAMPSVFSLGGAF